MLIIQWIHINKCKPKNITKSFSSNLECFVFENFTFTPNHGGPLGDSDGCWSFISSVYNEFQDTEEAGPTERIRSQICDSVTLYAQKYDEEFRVRRKFFYSLLKTLLRYKEYYEIIALIYIDIGD